MAKRAAYEADLNEEVTVSPERQSVGADPAKAGGAFGWIAWPLALAWLAGAGALAVGAVGLPALQEMAQANPLLAAGAGLMTLIPAFLILFAAAAAREGARGRAEAARLAYAAERMLNPSPGAEAQARRLGVSVRGEIAALDRALDQALQKIRDLEGVIARQTLSVDQASTAAQTGARHMISGLERERAELLQIADDLANRSSMIGDAITRHTRMVAEAARMAEAEVRAADEVLDSRLSSFGAAAAVIHDRTEALRQAAKATTDGAARLESALAGALDALATANTLTDAARHPAQATGHQAAGRSAPERRAQPAFAPAAQDNLARAAFSPAPAADRRGNDFGFAEPAPARRAQETAARATTAPAPAYDGARWTWREVLAAIDEEHPTGHAKADRREPPQRPAPAPVPTPAREIPSQPIAREADGGRQAQPERRRFFETRLTEPQPDRTRDTPPPRPPERRGFFGSFLSQDRRPQAAPVQTPTEEEAFHERWPQAPVPPPFEANRATAHAYQEAQPRPAARAVQLAEPDAPGTELIAGAGLRIADVFNAQAMERIANRARSGTQARRRAVREAAPAAVLRLAEYLDAHGAARADAAAFLRQEGVKISELLGRGRASMDNDTVRAFLLIDAASA
jgi:hypothetical protein